MSLRNALVALCLMGASPASAQDLGAALENWSIAISGTDGNDSYDAAYGVAIDSTGATLVAGQLDGDAGHGADAFVRKVDNLGAEVWTVTDDRGPVSGTKTNADDIFWDLEVAANDEICVVGEVSGDDSTGWDSGYYMARMASYDGVILDTDADGVPDFFDTWQDGGASTDQAAFGIALDSTSDMYIAGWSFRHANQEGQWAAHRYVGTTGLRNLGPLYYDNGSDPYARDQAFDIAVDSQGNIIVVGAAGDPGATGPADANRNFHVRKLDPTGALIWEDDWAGTAGLDDVATAVVVDSVDEITVVGYTNKGTDNAANADYDWLIVRYDAAGSSTGTGTTASVSPNRVWEVSWQDPTAPGPKEQAFDAHLAENGSDVVVGGTWDDSGNAAWRVAVLSWIDGAPVSEWTQAAQNGGDSAVRAIDMRDGTVAVAGTVWNGTDHDAALLILDPDDDADGVGNRVDGCPLDSTKLEPGECGCGSPDVDSDYDTYLDCNDACPQLAEKWDDEGICGCDETDDDGDGDGTPDCIDNCPTDPNKIAFGECGCNLPDDDSDNDGVVGCDDGCSNTPEGLEVNEFGCPPEVCDNGEDDDNNGRTDCDDSSCTADPACLPDDGKSGGDGGCGCDATTGAPASGLLGLALLALAIRRREDR